MIETTVVEYREIATESPVMIVGLPGIGLVGKLVADHLIIELKAEKFMEIFSPNLPPQVNVNPDGTIKLVSNELYFYKGNETTPDMIILVGDHQSVTNEGHYELAGIYLDIAERYKVRRIYTLGGYGTGKLIETPHVLYATNKPDIIEEVKSYGAIFNEGELSGGIIGASGLILGLGELRGMECVCFMGETSGYLVDPKSAQAVTTVLCKALNIEIDTKELEARAQEIEKIITKIKEMEQSQIPKDFAAEDKYIG
ncbi:proteasome assembly chaperone family protein [Methanocella sp. MCL-LM]|uniref:proteasome assembly chaperone family protein n=1 Tax=Methanocella sp. MCL-LM TaxID=3412035 RepID=UPI003C74B8DA